VPTLLAAAGCGSLSVHQLPPPATPAGGRISPAPRRATVNGRLAVLLPRARVLELRGGRRVERAGAGVGPAGVAADPRGRWLYVTDTTGGALLVFALRPRLELVHRVYLPGGPYAIAVRGDRLWVTLSARNQVAELNVRRRPQLLRRLPAAR
jgi:DNA-binding beta-propeller fold protein YncE